MNFIEPHGGKLIDRRAHDLEVDTEAYPKIVVNKDVILNIEQISNGAFSPLEGFMTSQDFNSVIDEMKLASGLVWTIPIILSIDDDKKQEIKRSKSEKVILVDENSKAIALMEVKDIYKFDKEQTAEKVFKTTDRTHPGVNYMMNLSNFLIGGKILQLKPMEYEYPEFMMSARQTRTEFKKRGWKTITGFQTRNIPHRAHEHHHRIALEITDGLFIQPIIGWKKVGDFKPDAIIRCHNALIENYYPKEKVLLGTLSTAMSYAGPREAVFHAIIRKNFGCTHFIVGGDHAGVGDYYETYDAHKIFDEIDDLGIQILRLKRSYYCHKRGFTVTDNVCGTHDKDHEEISGTKIRDMLDGKTTIDTNMVRPEVLAALSREDMIKESDL